MCRDSNLNHDFTREVYREVRGRQSFISGMNEVAATTHSNGHDAIAMTQAQAAGAGSPSGSIMVLMTPAGALSPAGDPITLARPAIWACR